MIQDDGFTFTAAIPGSGSWIASSFGYDLNPDYGQGQNARRAPVPGMGEEWLMRVDVGGDFTVGAGQPMAQFHMVLASSGAGTEVHLATSMISIGIQAPAQRLITWGENPPVGGLYPFSGFRADDLVQGAHFFIRPNPWSKYMGRNASDAVVDPQTLRYLGVAIIVPNYYTAGALAVGTPAYFDGGFITATLVKSSDIIQDPNDFAYPCGTKMVG